MKNNDAQQILVARQLLTKTLRSLGGPLEAVPGERISPQMMREAIQVLTNILGMLQETLQEEK